MNPDLPYRPARYRGLDRCPVCRYSLMGLPNQHRCPECGFMYDARTFVWRPRGLLAYMTAGFGGLFILAIIWWLLGGNIADIPPWLVGLAAICAIVFLAWSYRVFRSGPFLCIGPMGLTFRDSLRHPRVLLWSRIVGVVADPPRSIVVQLDSPRDSVRISEGINDPGECGLVVRQINAAMIYYQAQAPVMRSLE